MIKKSDEIENFIKQIAKLPSLGKRSATRIALHLIGRKDTDLRELIDTLTNIRTTVQICEQCGNFDTVSPCKICSDNDRNIAAVCVVSDVASLWAIERSGVFNGTYHILGGVLSVPDGITPENLNIYPLVERIKIGIIREVIIALPSTIDGKITAHYLSDKIKHFGVQITEIAQGIPMGGELDYLDDGTIIEAIKHRKDL
ncbi:MAG: recombination mediator RecR [Rickettsiales bacterium]|jgi:recombination protein RecR|nr:recombination mediator RecR [Rickettsiales bacterium]